LAQVRRPQVCPQPFGHAHSWPSVLLGMPTQLQGIGELVKRLERIRDACDDKPAPRPELKDEFLATKLKVNELLEKVRDDIRERTRLLKKRGNCHETIQRGHSIRQDLDELKKSLPKLTALHKRAQSKSSGKSTTKSEELQNRYQIIRNLKRQVDEVHDMFKSCNTGEHAPDSVMYGNPRATLLGCDGGLRAAARGNPGGDGQRPLAASEESALAAMKQRDREVDTQLDQVGAVIDRLAGIEHEIGATAQRQNAKVQGLNTSVENTEAEIEDLSKNIQEVMKYEKNTNFFCQIILGIALLCCVGFIFQQLS